MVIKKISALLSRKLEIQKFIDTLRLGVMDTKMKPAPKKCKENIKSLEKLVITSFPTSTSSFFKVFQKFLKENEDYRLNNADTFFKKQKLAEGNTDAFNNFKNTKFNKLSIRMPKSGYDFRKKPKMADFLKEIKAKSDIATNKANRHENMSENAKAVIDFTQNDCDVVETIENIKTQNISQDFSNIKRLPKFDNCFKNITDIKKRKIVPMVNNNYSKNTQAISNNKDFELEILKEIENIKEFKIYKQSEFSAILKEKNDKMNNENFREDSIDSVLASFEFITEEEAKRNGLYFLEEDSIPIMEGHFRLNSKPYKHTIPTGNDSPQLLQSNPRLVDSNKSIEPTGKCLNVYRGMGFYFSENNSDDSIELQRETAQTIINLYPEENRWHLKRRKN